MLHTPRDAIISVVSNKNSASATLAASTASKMPASNSIPGQALVPNLNQRSSWQSQSQQPGGYSHGMTQPHQIPIGGPLGGHVKKKRGRPPGSKNKIKIKNASENDSDGKTLGQAMPTQGREGHELTFGDSILSQGGSQLMPHYNQEGQTNYGLHASLQNQAAWDAGLHNAAHDGGTPTGWPPQQPAAPIHVNLIMNSNVIHNYGPLDHPGHAYYPTQ